MISEESQLAEKESEIPSLIETLLATEQRLEDLTDGQVDSVAGHNGRTFVLRRAQDQLRRNEAVKQNAILNALPAHIALLDGQGFIVAVNEAWRSFADANGLDATGRGVGLNYLAICDQAQGDYSAEARQVAAGIRAVLDRRQDTFSVEYPSHSPPNLSWFLLTVSPLARDHSNGAVVMHLNITERILTARALEELSEKTDQRERMLTTMLSNLHDFAYIYDRNGCFIFANQPLLDLWGLTLDAVVGKDFRELGYPDELAQRLQQELQEVFETGKIVTGETPYLSPTGVQGTYEYIFSPAFGAAGGVEFVVGSTRDITGRKTAELALKASEQEQRALAAQVATERERLVAAQAVAKVGSWETDLSTLEGVWSAETHRIFETTPNQFEPTHQHFLERVHPDDRASVEEAFVKSLDGRSPRSCEHRIVIPDGRIKFIEERWEIHRDEQEKPVRAMGTSQDITERKRIEEALRTSEERLRAALAASRTGTFRWVFHTNELNWDVSLDALFGIPDGNVVRSLETFLATVHPDDRANVMERCERCAREGADFDMEFRVVWPDGSIHWLDDKGKTFFDAGGLPLYMTGACVDITEHKLAEMALRQSAAEFRALAEAMPQMVWITRPDGWNIYFSQQWIDYTGLTLEESLGHGWIKPFHPDDQDRSWAAWQHATATVGVYSIESRLRRKDGVYRWWLIRGVPQMGPDGHILKWFGTCTDIQELKLAELEISRAYEALQESSDRFQQFANNISDVFWMTAPDFKTLDYVSPGYETIWGRSAASLYADPQQWMNAIVPEDRERAQAVIAKLMKGEPEASVEYRIARPDGSIRWIHDRGFQVRDAAGKLVGLTGVASDVTERKGLEAQLRQSQKMEAIGTLAGGIAHDFNNILAAIMGYTELAQKALLAGGRPHTQLAQVLKASVRARDLVQQILTFSNQEEHEQQALRVQDIIEETLELVRVSLPATIEIRRTIDNRVPRILGDATQIQQVIMNLCVNAGHAMKHGNGVLGISLTAPEIGPNFREAHPELSQGPHVLLSISDTGCGIDADLQTRIFDPFYTTKPPGEGTGLGLAVVHGVVKNHNGVINVQSEVGVGTTFSIYLPVGDLPAEALAPDADNILRGNGEHILFVDDEEALASLGKLTLEDIGYRVTAKTQSVEALAAFRAQPEEFDLVVTDQTMPRLNGADFAKALLEIRPALPVLLLTGYSTTMSYEIAKGIGIREVLFKPCPIQVLGEAIRRVLGAGRKRNE